MLIYKFIQDCEMWEWEAEHGEQDGSFRGFVWDLDPSFEGKIVCVALILAVALWGRICRGESFGWAGTRNNCLVLLQAPPSNGWLRAILECVPRSFCRTDMGN